MHARAPLGRHAGVRRTYALTCRVHRAYGTVSSRFSRFSRIMMIRHLHARAARHGLAAVLLATTLLVPAASRATTVLPLDLEGLTAAAGRIFQGRVIAVRSGRDGHGFPATWTTFAVDEALKGTAAATIEIKQLGNRGASTDGNIFRVPALPSYAVGDEVILFLHPESAEGFTSPVGLGQGRFRIRRGHGAPVAENDVGNTNLTTATTGASAPRSLTAPGNATAARSVDGDAPPGAGGAAPVAVDELLTRVRALTGATH
jgi:hypothetical protein